jgi:HPr kinase/phosphorylase
VTPASATLHASCVAVDGQGLLIMGPSGSGKSSLALRLLSLGAALVSDDLTRVDRKGNALVARCPTPDLAGLIEARATGIIRAPSVEAAEVTLAVAMDLIESERLPPFRTITILGCEVGLVLQAQHAHFPDALMLYLRHGRQA